MLPNPSFSIYFSLPCQCNLCRFSANLFLRYYFHILESTSGYSFILTQYESLNLLPVVFIACLDFHYSSGHDIFNNFYSYSHLVCFVSFFFFLLRSNFRSSFFSSFTTPVHSEFTSGHLFPPTRAVLIKFPDLSTVSLHFFRVHISCCSSLHVAPHTSDPVVNHLVWIILWLIRKI